MGQVSINGKTYNTPDGSSVCVINEEVYIDGKLISDLDDIKEKKIIITINGNCGNVHVDAANLTINGNIDGEVLVDAGNITCKGHIKGNVKCNCGNISCDNIFGNTDVECGNIRKGHSTSFNKFFNKIFG